MTGCSLFPSLTHSILSLLKQNNYYGLHPDHVTLMKQNGVPALKNSACAIATKEDGHIILKPHGHGDIHLLMNQVPSHLHHPL